ncbi:MAG: alpha/beta fold hydrolase [Candidatus Hydrogenedentes bacterium]|jgi:2-succinyl-6-hydroxy-2,4-cyclohexadiene-1-carboxylate synthase|nr:alpha/beta fold hydrolase [Candidatus Hydrogenedentota bacterium]
MTIPIGWHCFGSSKENVLSVLMLHGFMGCSKDWIPVTKALNMRNYRYVCPDLPGHGTVQHILEGADKSMKEVAAALRAGLPGRLARPCALSGYSMGGRLALYLALQYPTQFSRLVLISASPGIEDAEERAARRLSDKQLALHLQQFGRPGERLKEPVVPKNPNNTEPAWDSNFESFLKRWYSQPPFTHLQKKPDLRTRLIGNKCGNHPRALAASLIGMGTGMQPNLWHRIHNLKIPVLLITGEYDEKFTRIALAVKERVPHAQHAVIPDSGHIPQEENPGTFAAVLKVFLKGETDDEAQNAYDSTVPKDAPQ